MTRYDEMLDQELADTREAAALRRRPRRGGSVGETPTPAVAETDGQKDDRLDPAATIGQALVVKARADQQGVRAGSRRDRIAAAIARAEFAGDYSAADHMTAVLDMLDGRGFTG